MPFPASHVVINNAPNVSTVKILVRAKGNDRFETEEDWGEEVEPSWQRTSKGLFYNGILQPHAIIRPLPQDVAGLSKRRAAVVEVSEKPTGKRPPRNPKGRTPLAGEGRNRKTVTVRLDPVLHSLLLEFATATKRTKTSLVEEALWAWFENQ